MHIKIGGCAPPYSATAEDIPNIHNHLVKGRVLGGQPAIIIEHLG